MTMLYFITVCSHIIYIYIYIYIYVCTLPWFVLYLRFPFGWGQLKCNGTHAETRFCLQAKWTSPFKLVVVSVQSTTGSWGVCISSSNVGYTTFGSSMKGFGYPQHLPVSPSLPLPCITVCHHISTGVYLM